MKLRKFQPSSRMKKLMIHVMILLALLIAQPFIWRGVLGSSNRLHDLQTQEEQLVLAEEKIAELNAILENNDSRIERVDLSFPPIGSVPEIVASLERLADQRSVVLEIQSITEGRSPHKETENLHPLVVRLSAKSNTVANLVSYVDAVEHTLALSDVALFDLKVLASGAEPGSLLASQPFQVTLDVVFYLQPELIEEHGGEQTN